MKNCPTCNYTLADNAISCPKCGHAFKKTDGGISLKDPIHLIGIGIAIFMIFGIIMMFI